MRVRPEYVTAGLQEHEVELVRERGLADSQNHALATQLSQFLRITLLLRLLRLRFRALLAQIEPLYQQLPSILLALAQVVAAIDERGLFDREDLDLNLLPVLLALQLRYVDLDVDFGVGEVLLHADDQLLGELRVRDARAVLGKLGVRLVLHDLDVLSSGLLEVRLQELPLFDALLEQVEGDLERGGAGLEGDHVEGEVHDLLVRESRAQNVVGVDLDLALGLVDGGLAEHGNELLEVFLGQGNRKGRVDAVEIGLDVEELPAEGGVACLVEVLQALDEVARDFEGPLPNDHHLADLLRIL